MYRIGFGYDTHKLVEGRKLILGGINIPFEKGLDGHSDADVLIHAICDALLGATALGDIGKHFPNTNEKFKGIDSAKILILVKDMVEKEGYKVLNIDSTICAERPKLQSYIDMMRDKLASTLLIKKSQVSIKATTNEKLGFIGREEGISAYAVVLLTKEKLS